jgi:hypothetical protein
MSRLVMALSMPDANSTDRLTDEEVAGGVDRATAQIFARDTRRVVGWVEHEDGSSVCVHGPIYEDLGPVGLGVDPAAPEAHALAEAELQRISAELFEAFPWFDAAAAYGVSRGVAPAAIELGQLPRLVTTDGDLPTVVLTAAGDAGK